MGILLPSPEDFSQASGTIDFDDLNSIYEAIIDETFVGMSRIITLHLPPQIQPDPTSFGNNTNAYNPFFRQTVVSPDSTKITGVRVNTRDIQFHAHIVIGPHIFEDEAIGRLESDEAQTTTVIDSHGHIASCQTATIDGLRYRLAKGPRTFGFKYKTYVLSKWVRVNEREGTDSNSNT